ncbi:hypothetical protein [Desulfitobacterium sp. AusDCA]|uniref:hypothetical protein n=1 Tax=Desulfitobacterium sp. AusDCA TaxID=3240383 RepID=UPI003DA74E09
MEKMLKKVTVSSEDLLLYLTLPILVTGLLAFDTQHLFLKFIINTFTALLVHVPPWSIPIVAPLSLLILFLGLPMAAERVFKPQLGKILFGSISLTFSILLIYFMISLDKFA